MKKENYKPTGRKAGSRMTEDEKNTIKKNFLKAFQKYQGEWKKAAEEAGTCVATVKHWMKNDEVFNDRVYEIDQSFVDEVEQALMARIREGDTRAMIFYLRCKAKDRGYIQSTARDLVNGDDSKKKEEEKLPTEYKLDFGDE